MTDPDPIASVVTTTVTVPLPRTLRLGAFEVRQRHYALVRVTTDSGLTGCAYAQTRGAPISQIIDALLTPVVAGKDSAAVDTRWQECFTSTVGVGRTGLVVRALSLLDIALWDIRGQRAGLPLYRLLGGTRDQVPVMIVAGYPQRPGDIEEVVATARQAAADGHRLIKIARAADPTVMNEVLRQLAGALPETARIVVDGSWVWERTDDAVREIATWRDAPLAWVEDPFRPEDVLAYRDLRRSTDVPVGVGDEVTDTYAFERLAENDGMDVLRLDVATIGGITPALRVARRAENWGLPVSLHISPEVSAHLAAALPGVNGIETFVRSGNPYDPSHELITGGPEFTGGQARLSAAPGLGFTLRE